MLKDLNKNQQALAEYMSDLSNESYCASWLFDLEFILWEVLKGKVKKFGMLEISKEHISKLKELSDLCGGWIYLHDDNEETFLNLKEWERYYSKHIKLKKYKERL